eukprot:758950-Prymnesium_polylepis.1
MGQIMHATGADQLMHATEEAAAAATSAVTTTMTTASSAAAATVMTAQEGIQKTVSATGNLVQAAATTLPQWQSQQTDVRA